MLKILGAIVMAIFITIYGWEASLTLWYGPVSTIWATGEEIPGQDLWERIARDIACRSGMPLPIQVFLQAWKPLDGRWVPKVFFSITIHACEDA